MTKPGDGVTFSKGMLFQWWTLLNYNGLRGDFLRGALSRVSAFRRNSAV